MGSGLIGAIFLFIADSYMKNNKIFIYKEEEKIDNNIDDIYNLI